MPDRAFDAAFRRLAALTDYETMATVRYDARTYGLDRAAALLDDLGRPSNGALVLQVVGSKGKGTASAAAASILRASGLRTGLYLSPHLVHPSERILVDGRPASGRAFAAAVDRVLPLALARSAGERPTFFELMTAAALWIFEREGCGAVVLEAGMGGRLDATTAARRDAVLLVQISLEHTAQLGRTTARIAGEKAAAATRGAPFLSLVPPGSAAGRVVAARCRRAGAPLLVAGRDFEARGAATRLDADGPRTRFDLVLRPGFPGAPRGATLPALEVPLLGAHQAGNAALAAAAVLALAARGGQRAPRADAAAVRAGLAGVRLDGRLQVVRRRPLVLVDGAHNGASLRAARRAVAAVADPAGRLRVVFAAHRGKDHRGMLRALRGVERLLVTEVDSPRRAAAADLVALARAEGLRARAAGSPREALRAALRASRPRDTVLVAGSLYLAGAVLPIVRGRK
jgi:dihydrofolate synthase/folylpolyglutamate synthase